MHRLVGIVLIAISASSFGAMAIFARIAYASGADAITVLFLRFFLASLVMIAAMFLRGSPFPRGRPLLVLVSMGALGYVGQSFCFFTALTMASAGLVAILLYLYPAFVTILSALLLRAPVTRRKTVALFLSLGGTLLIIGLDVGGSPLGIALAIAAPVIYSFYILAGSRVVPVAGAFPSSAVVMISAGAVYGMIAAVRGPTFPATLVGWVCIVAIALVSTVLAISTFFAGLKRLDPASASMISTLEPVVTVLLAALFLEERITRFTVLGGLMILGAVLLLARNGKRAGDVSLDRVPSPGEATEMPPPHPPA
ncbi:MAG: EamA family transporter [Deltaproteobacteria bacterium]|nr:EamA family transporter [Deltaproteobacteria bacterium]